MELQLPIDYHTEMLIYYIVSQLKVGGLSCEGPKHTGGLFQSNDKA